MKKILFPVEKDRVMDRGMEKAISIVKERTSDRNNDFMVLCVGMTGTGKSMLSMHSYEIYDETPIIDYIALSKEEFKESLNKVKDKDGTRFLCYDEAEAMGREAMTKWNRSLVKLYMKIRGLNIFHWWNNPSPRIDKEMIDIKVNLIIYIYTTGNPRRYWALPRSRVQKMMDDLKAETLTFGMLREYARKYAAWRGWFRDYRGKLRPSYDKKKEAAMKQAVEDFNDVKKPSLYVQNTTFATRVLGISPATLVRRSTKWIAEGFISEGKDYLVDALGHRKWTVEGQERVKELLKAEGGVL